VASGVDFFVGMTAAAGAVSVEAGAALLFTVLADAAGELLLVAAGELAFSAAGEADFSVVTDTLGSEAGELSGAAASGMGAGVEVSSWARAKGAVATARAASARMVIFIGLFLFRVDYSAFARTCGQDDLRLVDFQRENEPYFAASSSVKAVLGHFGVQPAEVRRLPSRFPAKSLASLVLLAT
jgi:hypothetical protein